VFDPRTVQPVAGRSTDYATRPTNGRNNISIKKDGHMESDLIRLDRDYVLYRNRFLSQKRDNAHVMEQKYLKAENIH
jgi:hypothetical protein